MLLLALIPLSDELVDVAIEISLEDCQHLDEQQRQSQSFESISMELDSSKPLVTTRGPSVV